MNKKIISIITLTIFLSQLIPGIINAAPVYDNVYESGNLYLPYTDSSSIIRKYDSTAAIAFTASDLTAGTGESFYGIAFLPNGDLVTNSSTNKIYCLTKESDYTLECSWSPYEVTLPSGSDYSRSLTVASNGDIWMAHSGLTITGDYVSRTLESSDYTTHETYDLSDYGHCVDTQYTDKTSCEAALSTWYNYVPLFTAVDYTGDVWVTMGYDGQGFNFINFGKKVICLDAQNSFSRCSGDAFDSQGGITVSNFPFDIVINSKGSLFITHLANGNNITKIAVFANYKVTTTTDVGVSVHDPQFIAIDSNDNIFFNRNYNGGAFTGQVRCLTSDLTECSGSIGSGVEYTQTEDPFNIFVDNNDDVWTVRRDVNRLYCFDASNNYAGCAQIGSRYEGNTNFTNVTEGSSTNSYLAISGLSYGTGDPTGAIIKNLFNLTPQDQVSVTALVDPTISFSIRNSLDNADTNTCALGTVAADDVAEATCAYRLAVSTNAKSGYNVYLQAVGALTDGTNNITNISEGGTVTVGTEGYGIRLTALSSGGASGATYTEGTDAGTYDFTDDDTPIPTTKKTLISVNKPAEYTVGNTTTSSLVTHALGVSTVTPAGTYTQTVIHTVTGNF